MNKKISELPAADPLAGDESLPAVQGGANVKTTPLDVANLAASVPAGMNPFRVLNFGSSYLDPNNNETIVLATPSPNSTAIAMCVVDGEGGLNVLGLFGSRTASGMFVEGYDPGYPFSIGNCNGLALNSVHIMDSAGSLLDDYGDVVLNRSAGSQAPIADATGAGDVVARLNDLLAALRNLQLIRT